MTQGLTVLAVLAASTLKKSIYILDETYKSENKCEIQQLRFFEFYFEGAILYWHRVSPQAMELTEILLPLTLK